MKVKFFLENLCLYCGETIPEGLQICPKCEKNDFKFKVRKKSLFTKKSTKKDF